MLYINILPKEEDDKDINEDNEYSKSLLEELTNIVGGNNVDTSDDEDDVEEEPEYHQEEYHTNSLLKEFNKKRKKDKKKKRKKKNDLNILNEDSMDYTGEFIDKNGKLVEITIPRPNIDLLDYYKEDDTDDSEFVDKIVDPNRKAYQKLKKDKNKFKREYAEELTLLYDTLKETDKFSKDILKRYQELNGSKQRGLSKYAIDLADTVLSSKQTKLNIIKEIASVKKNALDQKTKYEAQLAKMEAEMNKAQAQQQAADLGLMGSGYLQNILEYGRKNFINTMTGDGTYEEENYINTGDGLYINEDHDEDEEILSMIEDHYEDEAELDDLISNRLQSNRSNRSAEGNKYIQYEHRKPVIKISLNEDTGEYSFFAVDQDGNVLDDFPLPSDDHKINPIRFSLDNSYGTDKRGRQYKTVLY